MKHYTHLSKEERENIYKYLQEGDSQQKIAEKLHRDPSTVSREITRNHSLISRSYNHLSSEEKQQKKKDIYHYLPDTAQDKCEKRRKEVNWRAPLKRTEVFVYTVSRLKDGWSPDIISGNLKLLFPGVPSMWISHECIYQFIYTKKGEELGLRKYLLRSHKRRKKKTGRSVRKANKIPNRVDISLRPKEVEERKECGHFEGDSILSIRSTYSALRTELERKSRFLFVRRIPRKTAEYTEQATLSIYSSLPYGSVKSTTWDNGTEGALHEIVTQTLNIPIYFAEPYKSWQRGSNEHANGMLRRFFPKGTNFDEVSDEEIQEVVDYLNNRPRKILGYKTPKQVFDTYLATFL